MLGLPLLNSTAGATAEGSRQAPSTAAERCRDLICLVVLVLVWLALWMPRLTGPINFRWDASAYYILGTALSEGHGYRPVEVRDAAWQEGVVLATKTYG